MAPVSELDIKMGKRKDLSKFDNGQIVMVRRPNQIKTLLWSVPRLQWSVPTNGGPRKEQWEPAMGSWMAKAH